MGMELKEMTKATNMREKTRTGLKYLGNELEENNFGKELEEKM